MQTLCYMNNHNKVKTIDLIMFHSHMLHTVLRLFMHITYRLTQDFVRID